MLQAFVLATFGWWSVLQFLCDHIIALGGVGLVLTIVAAGLLAIFLPAAIPLLRTALDALLDGSKWLIGTAAGRIVLLAVACLFIGFETSRFVDRAGELHAQLAAQRQATETAQEAAAQARLQAALLAKVSGDAARRAEAAEADDTADEEAAADLEDRFEAADRAAAAGKARPRGCKLTAAEAAAIDGIGAPRPATH